MNFSRISSSTMTNSSSTTDILYSKDTMIYQYCPSNFNFISVDPLVCIIYYVEQLSLIESETKKLFQSRLDCIFYHPVGFLLYIKTNSTWELFKFISNIQFVEVRSEYLIADFSTFMTQKV